MRSRVIASSTIHIVAGLVAGLLTTGCGGSSSRGNGGGDAGGVACLDGLQTLRLTPADSAVQLDGTTAPEIPFTALGTFSSGEQPLEPGQLHWSASRDDDTPPGTMASNVYTPNAESGGVVTIKATDGCVTGQTTITLRVETQVGAPTDPAPWAHAGEPTTDGLVPTIVYPSDQTRFPRNIHRTLFQWRTSGHTQFRLVFVGAGSTVTVYTDGAHALCADKTPAAGCWEADERAWRLIAGSNAGGTVTWTVDALDTTVPTVPVIRRSATNTIGFSKRDVRGAIFYWSTTAKGIRRAHISAAEPENYLVGTTKAAPGTSYQPPDVPSATTVTCVACHVVSRSGKYLAAPVQSSLPSSLWITEVTAAPPPKPLVTYVAGTEKHGFATISPDDQYVVAAWGGKMWQLDRATGLRVSTDDLPLGGNGTHPDWSPDNTQLVYATGSGDAPAGASIATIQYNGGSSWGTPNVIDAADGQTNLFPMFNPDGNWVAFSRGEGGHGDLKARLYVVHKTGTNGRVELRNANCVVSNQTDVCETENNQPTWAPPGDMEWVAFNSFREYGVVKPFGTQQIWVAAVDKSKLGTGADPSYPAFRLQFQGLNENNHRAFWTLDVREPPPPTDAGPPRDAGMCIADDQPCNPASDHCCSPTYYCGQTGDAGYSCRSGLQ